MLFVILLLMNYIVGLGEKVNYFTFSLVSTLVDNQRCLLSSEMRDGAACRSGRMSDESKILLRADRRGAVLVMSPCATYTIF